MSDPSMNALMDAFGPNAGYAYELLAQYREAPASVDETWRRIFAALEPQPGSASAPPPAAASCATWKLHGRSPRPCRAG